MAKIRELLKLDLHSPRTLYNNDLYLLTVAYQIKKEKISELNELYQNLPIHTQKDIVINGMDIANILNKKPGDYLKDIINNCRDRKYYQVPIVTNTENRINSIGRNKKQCRTA